MMSLTLRELWTAAHGMILGAVFLLGFAGGLAGLYSLRPALLTTAGLQERLPRIKWGTGIMAIMAWLAVISGTYIVYPWYRATPPEGLTDLSAYPRSFLNADPNLAGWHTFGMEWKEHVAWFAPILATAVFYIVWKYGPQLAENDKLRKMVIVLFILAFSAAAIAGLFGALITKAAPIL
jgi:phosphoglycerol transferase MdoB-like AlkP superfamily enzyme